MPLEDFELPALMAPISDEVPQGTDATESELWFLLDNDFEAALQMESQLRTADAKSGSSITVAEVRKQWQSVAEQAQTVLVKVGKDLRAAGCLIQALVRLWGFAGFRRGLDGLAGLLETYWAGDPQQPLLFPRPNEDDGLEATFLPLIKLDSGYLLEALQRVPLTQMHGDLAAYTTLDYVAAQNLRTMTSEEREWQMERGAATVEDIQRGMQHTSDDFVRGLHGEVRACLKGLERLEELFQTRGAFESPVSRDVQDSLKFRGAIKAITLTNEVLVELAGSRLALAEEDGEAAAGDGDSGFGIGRPLDSVIQSREDAFAVLERVAVYFEKSEPQSTIPAQLRKIVRQGRLRPEDFLRAIVDDESVLQRLLERLGFAGTDVS